MHFTLGLLILSQNAMAADIDLDVELPDDGVSVSVHASDVTVGNPLPAVVLYDSEGAEIKVTANVVGAVDGEAVVQVVAVRTLSWDDADGFGSRSSSSWKVVQGFTEWTGRRWDRDADDEGEDWIRFSVRQAGIMESTRPGRYHLDLLLPENFNLLFVGHVVDEVGVAETAGIPEFPLGGALLAAGAACRRNGRGAEASYVVHPPELEHRRITGRPEMRVVISLMEEGVRGKLRLVDEGSCSFRTATGELLEYTFTVKRI